MISRGRRVALGLTLALAGAVLVTGCGGGGSGSTVPNVPASVAAAQPQSTQVPGAAPSGHSEIPSQADAFVDSIGVNVHLSYYGTPYGDNFSLVLQRLKTLGVRHVRDGFAVGQNNLCGEYAQLAAAGIHDQSLTNVTSTTAELQSWAKCIGSALEAFEGPNEYDINHGSDGSWPQTLSAYQATLYQFVKSNLPGVAVVGPSLTTASAYAAVGNLSNVVDEGNVHDYFGGRNPGTTGWGATTSFGTYGSTLYNMAVARQSTSTKPIISTETGYGDQSSDTNWVPSSVKVHYTLRTALEHWNAGIKRTDFYQLLDQGGAPFASYGLLDSAGNAKPAYTALKNLIGRLSDPGAAFTPNAFSYTINAGTSVHHALFQRRDGSICIALWLEV
ncbi:MAG TPA: hypothetical protein VE591_08465, partial [Candidatus Acidoferrum sp.]|nr:hypothetical protein [Candidatus Acidoferrum sp.]